ncbi:MULTISPECIES: TetR/AcrR family transcriptional regulator [Methylobacterium]|nr:MULTISPECIES: TetR/AcrR family transcriptional regulator [Methylobacterium]MBK3396471.1 TetR/AcrR family transcriptional regulator [Methylobacterium ajmalii]MBK3407811.1 TetR/AcrR family transcriptional regulator [Methylobacterium ajmalii]MBK3420569.1 TetR/AcrR family transcriptional regulator [Methylobacterium ajmalii]MBZ6412425.1 TetR/AcrR family transcriptional regulator [Methylobacterium sp.]
MSIDRTTADPLAEAGPAETDKRRQILDGAREVFLASGFDGASMGAIAKAAGVSKGTLYVYFESKESLFEALTIEEKRSLAENICRLDHDDPDIAAVLRRLGTSLMEAMVRPDHIASVRMVIGAAEKFPRFGRAFYEAGPLLGRTRLRAYLDAQVAAGRLRAMDSDLAARHFFDLCAATTMRRLLFAVGDPPTEAETTYWVAEAVRVFLAAYGPEGR